MSASVKVTKNELPKMARTAAAEIVDAAAREIAVGVLQRAMVNLERQVYTRPNIQVTASRVEEVPEPTGALGNSGYIRTFGGKLPAGVKSEQEAMSAARSSNSDITFGQAPPGPQRLGQVQVLFAVYYGLYVEMGTVLGMLPRPYLRPAADEFQGFAKDFVLAKLRKAGFT